MAFTEKELPCPYQEGELYGLLYLPENYSGRLPVIILSHGIFSSYQMTAPDAKTFAELGFACYCFDFRGCSYSNKSGGEPIDCSVLTETDELLAVIDFIKEQDFTDKSRLFLLGHSLGGVVTALASAKRTGDIQKLALMYPAFTIRHSLSALFPNRDNIPDVIPNFIGTPFSIGRRFVIDGLDAPLEEAQKTFHKPVYIIHGTNDEMIPAASSEAAVKTYADARLHIVPDAPHGFNLDKETAAVIAEFLLN